MKKDITELPADVQEQIRALESLSEDQIDTNDAPEILDWSDARRGNFYRPVKQQITLRLDAEYHSLVQGPCSRRSGIPDGYQRGAPRARTEEGSFHLNAMTLWELRSE